MATDAQIRAESWWRREEVPVPLDKLVDDLCTHYGVPRTNGGTKGNEAHRKGRHRSPEWCLKSAFCTNPSYGTTDARDRRGNPRLIRAFDFEFKTDAEFWAACHRLDDAVRAGRCPYLAEWFGTFDGKKVVGWFEGRPGTADSSHLEHLHGGLWTESADDPAALAELFDIITGADDMTPDQANQLKQVFNFLFVGGDNLSCGEPVPAEFRLPGKVGGVQRSAGNSAVEQLRFLRGQSGADVDEAALAAALAPLLDAGATPEEVAAAVRAELDKTRLTGG